MEAVSLMIMKLQYERGEFLHMDRLKETTTPIILNSPIDHLPLYPGMWESELRQRMQYFRNEYQQDQSEQRHPAEILIPMKITLREGKKEISGWLLATIDIRIREVSFQIPRRNMRKHESYFQRLGDELWGMTKIYCIPKLKAKLRAVNIDTGVTDAEEVEDGYMTAAIMWQKAVCRLQNNVVSNEVNVMERNSILMMMAIEQ